MIYIFGLIFEFGQVVIVLGFDYVVVNRFFVVSQGFIGGNGNLRCEVMVILVVFLWLFCGGFL